MSTYQSVFKTQCHTFRIAQELTGLYFDATPGYMAFKPPYCLRIVRQYRTSEHQAFRDTVAKEAKARRN